MPGMVFDDHVGLGERPVDVADDLDDVPDDVAGAFMDRRRRGAHRRFGVDHGGPRLVLDPNQLGRVGGLVRIGSDHRRDRLADVADLAPGERPLRPRRVQTNIGVGAVRA